jgi:hypothetical protein
MAMTWEQVREVALAWPGMADSRSYGTPSLKVHGKFVARLREDGATVALRIDVLERQERMVADPAAFFITDHYANYPAVVVRLAKVKRRDLAELIEAAWRDLAPKRVVAAHDSGRSASTPTRAAAPVRRPTRAAEPRSGPCRPPAARGRGRR